MAACREYALRMYSLTSSAGRSVRLSLAAALAVALCAVSACRSKPDTASPAATPPDTWAVVDGRAITRDAVEKAFRQARDASAPMSDEEGLTARLALLDDLIIQDLLLAKARELKIEIPEADLDKAYAEAKQNMPEEAYQKELTARQLTTADMREGLRRQLFAQKVLEREVTSKVSVTDQDVSAFYDANRAQFNVAEEAYRIAQIAVTPVREPQSTNRTGDDATTPEAAAAKVRMLTEKLKGGTQFSELARDYSEDAESAARGGDLGFVPVSQLRQASPALRNAVLNKSPGSVNVVSSGGAHLIVLVVAHEQAGQRDLSMPGVKETITDTLKGRREQLLRTAYLSTLRNDAEIVNHLARRVVESPGKVPSLAPAAPGR